MRLQQEKRKHQNIGIKVSSCYLLRYWVEAARWVFGLIGLAYVVKTIIRTIT